MTGNFIGSYDGDFTKDGSVSRAPIVIGPEESDLIASDTSFADRHQDRAVETAQLLVSIHKRLSEDLFEEVAWVNPSDILVGTANHVIFGLDSIARVSGGDVFIRRLHHPGDGRRCRDGGRRGGRSDHQRG